RRGVIGLAVVAATAVPAAAGAAPDRDIEVTWKEPQDSTSVVKAAVKCSADCEVEIRGKLEIPRAVDPSTGEITRRRTAKLRPDSDELEARRKGKFRLRIPSKARPALENVLAADGIALARLKVFTTEASGKSGRVRARIELAQRP
ncbi:MAG: hypothetical protein ACRDL3_04470, partial [Solirubrobacterales bacterium]